MPRTARERAALLAHLAGPQPVKANELVRLRKLAGRGLIALKPHGERPHTSSLTRRGRDRAAMLVWRQSGIIVPAERGGHQAANLRLETTPTPALDDRWTEWPPSAT